MFQWLFAILTSHAVLFSKHGWWHICVNDHMLTEQYYRILTLKVQGTGGYSSLLFFFLTSQDNPSAERCAEDSSQDGENSLIQRTISRGGLVVFGDLHITSGKHVHNYNPSIVVAQATKAQFTFQLSPAEKKTVGR